MWRHSSLSRTKKISIFNVTIVSKLTHGLATALLKTAERRSLNGFQNCCLRAIWGITPVCVSRVSNKTVLATTGQVPLTHHLAKQQLLHYGKAARAPEGNSGTPRFALSLLAVTLWPATERPAATRMDGPSFEASIEGGRTLLWLETGRRY